LKRGLRRSCKGSFLLGGAKSLLPREVDRELAVADASAQAFREGGGGVFAVTMAIAAVTATMIAVISAAARPTFAKSRAIGDMRVAVPPGQYTCFDASAVVEPCGLGDDSLCDGTGGVSGSGQSSGAAAARSPPPGLI